MGYPLGYKGYKLLDTATSKLIISRDVQFFEDKYPFHNSNLQVHSDPFETIVLPNTIPFPDSAPSNIEPPPQPEPPENGPPPPR